MQNIIQLFKRKPIYLFLLLAPMPEAIWSIVTGVNIINLLTDKANSTFWIALLTFITFAPGAILIIFTSKWANYKNMMFFILFEAITQLCTSFYVGYHANEISPSFLALVQFIIVFANSLSTPCIFMLSRDLLETNELKTSAFAVNIAYVTTQSLGLLLAPVAKFDLPLSYIFYIEGFLALLTGCLLIIIHFRIPRKYCKESMKEDDYIGKLSNLKFLKLVFSKKENIILFLLPSFLYIGMTIPTDGIPVWANQNRNFLNYDFIISYSTLLWARLIGSFFGPFIFQKYYPNSKANSFKIISIGVLCGSLLYAIIGSFNIFNIYIIFPIIVSAHLCSNYSWAAIYFEIEKLGKGTFYARLTSWILATNFIFLGLGPIIIGRFGDVLGINRLWIINFIILIPLFIFILFYIYREVGYDKKTKIIYNGIRN